MQNLLRSLGLYLFYLFLIVAFTDLLYVVAKHQETLHHIDFAISPLDYEKGGIGGDAQTYLQRLQVQPFNLAALLIFFLALLHIFLAHPLSVLAESLYQKNLKRGVKNAHSFSVEMLRFLSEVEVIFGLWVIPLMGAIAYYYNWETAIYYLETRDFTEPLFVVSIMIISQTRPVIALSEKIVCRIARAFGDSVKANWFSILTFGPLLGSLITEPAAMTISALLIAKRFYCYFPKKKLAFSTLGLLFTNISVGGVFTNFAAPPVLMVQKAWGWTSYFMLTNFGYKALIGILLANLSVYFLFRSEFARLEEKKREFSKNDSEKSDSIPFWITLCHFFFLVWIVIHASHPVIFIGSILLFLGFYQATMPFQAPLYLRGSILVGFFLAGLVVHGTLQAWWVSLLLQNVQPEMLQLLATLLTAVNDNAEITFLASMIPSFTEPLKIAVVAGAVTGGGLTVIANAPNLAGQSLLKGYFPEGITVFGLFFGALFPTLLIGLCFTFL